MLDQILKSIRNRGLDYEPVYGRFDMKPNWGMPNPILGRIQKGDQGSVNPDVQFLLHKYKNHPQLEELLKLIEQREANYFQPRSPQGYF